MRRMMHATALLLVTASQVHSQSFSDQTSQSQSAEVHDEIELKDPTSKQFVSAINHSAPEFIPRGSGHSYSMLANYMSCSDWSPNLWNNYSCERAAIAAQISQHVDMQCKCFDCKQGLHSHHSGPCGETAGQNCTATSGKKSVNRYRQPFSTLYPASSDSCKAPCITVSSRPSTSCGAAQCVTAENQGAHNTLPVSHTTPIVPPLANPPLNRVALPVINKPKSSDSSFSILFPQPSFEARR